MFNIRVLKQEDTEKLLKMGEVIEAVEKVYTMKAQGNTEVFPLVFQEFDPGVADMDIKSGWLKSSGIYGLKSVSWFGENPQKGLPALIGAIMIFDASTGAPVGLLDGSYITGIRTGAAGAIGAKYLARTDSRTLLMVGAGHIATFLIAATLDLLPQIEKVLIYDALNFDHAAQLAGSIADTVHALGVSIENVCFEAVRDIAAATGESDVVITGTPSKEPIIKKDWVKPGTHFSCIGADMSGKEEIDPELFRSARVFVDDIEQNIKVGEIEIPLKRGIMSKEDIAGEIGEVVLGNVPGRESEDQITVFDATGTALLDLMTGYQALERAEQEGIGQIVEL